MDRLRFTSRLSSSDIKVFLTIYANMSACKIVEIVRNVNEVSYYIQRRDSEYLLKCSDFSMKFYWISRDYDAIASEQARPDENDWFCFLKRKFSMEYQIYYANLFDAKGIIFNKPTYISQISFNEFTILIKNLLKYERKFDSSYLEIIEVESFFQSERRFFVSGLGLEKPFYMRISDFQIIQPRAFSYKFRLIMEKMFGKEYDESYSDFLKTMISPDINIKEFKPMESMA